MSPGLVVLVLSLLLGFQPIATDLYLPALPAITQGFAASMPQAQLTLTAMLLAFGVSQLAWGPISDRYGRRPVLLWGAGAYVLAALGGVFAGSMEALIGWRILQGMAMGAAVMCARAIVRDLYTPVDGARMMSKGLTGLGMLACTSAPIGGALAQAFGWRATVSALAVYGAVVLGVLAWRFQETLPARNPKALQPLEMARIWWGILQHPTFWTFTLLATATYAGLFTFLATSPFVFIQVLGLSKTQYGLLMFSMSATYILGTLLCRYWIPRLGVRRTVAVGAAFSLAGGSGMALTAWLGWHSLWAIMGPFYAFILAHGIHQPCGQSGAVSPFPQAAGAASAMSGFLMMLVAFFMGDWLGRQMPADGSGSVQALAQGLWLWSLVIALAGWTIVQRYGELRTPPQRTVSSGA